MKGEAKHYHPGLDTYDPKAVDEKEMLNEESAKKLRSGLGICLYLAHDRIDIQYAVKIRLTCQDRRKMPTMNYESWHVTSGVRLFSDSNSKSSRKSIRRQESCF